MNISLYYITMAAEAAALSRAHQTWMVELLQEKDGSVSYEELVEVGEYVYQDNITTTTTTTRLKKKNLLERERRRGKVCGVRRKSGVRGWDG